MRLLFALILCLFLATVSAAQEETQTPYEIALQRIEEARLSGAIELDLRSLGLSEIPVEIGNLTNLEALYLFDNQLNSLPLEIENLINLRVLTLDGNRFENLPTQILSLRELQDLVLNGNLISTIPAEIGQLSNLKNLSLSFMQLASLPMEIGNLENLQGLSLAGNGLTEIPSEIGRLKHLCWLDISYNQLQHLPPELGQLSLLTDPNACNGAGGQLYFEGNPLISPPPEVIAQGTVAILEYLHAVEGNQTEDVQEFIQTSLLWSFAALIAALALGVFTYFYRIKWERDREKI